MSIKDTKNILNTTPEANILNKENSEKPNFQLIKYDDIRAKKIISNYEKNLKKLVISDKDDKQVEKRMAKAIDTIEYYDKYFKCISINGRKQRKRIIQEYVTSENFKVKNKKIKN